MLTRRCRRTAVLITLIGLLGGAGATMAAGTGPDSTSPVSATVYEPPNPAESTLVTWLELLDRFRRHLPPTFSWLTSGTRGALAPPTGPSLSGVDDPSGPWP